VKYLLDANIISEIRKGDKCDAHVAGWYSKVNGLSLCLSVVVTGELRKGIELACKHNPAKAAALETWLDGLRDVFQGRILPITEEITDEWGRMSALRPLAVIDGLLAASAKVHRLVLVTRNTADVTGLGVDVTNPFNPGKR
jgi:toxin FitB